VVAAAPLAAAAPAALPAGFSAQQVALGKAIYMGQAKGGTCAGCHGSDGKGSSAGASLAGPAFLWSDGSVEGLAKTITAGVATPKKANGGMPALGGAPLDEADVKAVAAYVWTLGHGGNGGRFMPPAGKGVTPLHPGACPPCAGSADGAS
jgi:mono/diheme cytochrome c family protein